MIVIVIVVEHVYYELIRLLIKGKIVIRKLNV